MNIGAESTVYWYNGEIGSAQGSDYAISSKVSYVVRSSYSVTTSGIWKYLIES